MKEKIKKICEICLIVSVFNTPIFANEILYFMPYEKKEAFNALKNAILKAQSEIKVSVYSFTNNELAKAIRDSAKRGVKVSIIYDKESNIKNTSSTIGYLAKYNNVSVCLLSGALSANQKFYGLMHQKMAIIDQDLLILGSANWSKNAFENNYETLLFTHQRNFVQKALAAYERMKKTCVGF